MTEETSDQRVAKLLGMSPDAVAHVRNHFNDSSEGAIIRTIQMEKLKTIFDEQQRKLRTTNAAELPKIQGALDCLERAISVITNRLDP